MAISDIGSSHYIEDLTPSDTTDLSPMPRAVRVATGGDVKITPAKGNVPVVISGVVDGEYLPVLVKRLWATGTTASGFTGFF